MIIFINSLFPLHVAIDGNNLVYAIYYQLLEKSWSKTLSYYYVRSLVTNFFNYLKQCNIIVDAICFDMWSEKMYKMVFNRIRSHGDFCTWENDDYCEIDSTLRISPSYRDSGILWTTMRWIIQENLYQAVGRDKVFMCGVDSDRYESYSAS